MNLGVTGAAGCVARAAGRVTDPAKAACTYYPSFFKAEGLVDVQPWAAGFLWRVQDEVQLLALWPSSSQPLLCCALRLWAEGLPSGMLLSSRLAV